MRWRDRSVAMCYRVWCGGGSALGRVMPALWFRRFPRGCQRLVLVVRNHVTDVAISIGTLVASAGIAYYDGRSIPSLLTVVLNDRSSAWTIVASLVFSQPTVQNLALGASLAIAGLAVAGLTGHEFSLERAARSVKDTSADREGRLAAAA
jgi:hypothetical protein